MEAECWHAEARCWHAEERCWHAEASPLVEGSPIEVQSEDFWRSVF